MNSASNSAVLIRSSLPSFWNSCVSIVKNLEASYSKAYSEKIQFFDYYADIDDHVLLSGILRLKEQRVEELIFIDHYPALTKFFLALDCVWQTDLPKVTIHAFGDFAPRCQEYLKIEEILKKFPVKIISPSSKALNFLSNHFNPTANPFLHTVPFAISSDKFFFQEELRKNGRKYFDINESDKVITYAGRISSQKNVLFTLQVVSEYLASHPDVLFILAGSDDNFGTPIFGEFEARGSMALAFRKSLENLPHGVKERVRFVHNLDQERLRLLLNSSDLFISLSTYHNEDFGMAPLEALATGCPAVITDWGGYKDYASEECSLVKVQLTKKGLELDSQDILMKIHHHLQKTNCTDERKKCSEYYLNAFDESSASKKLTHHQQIPHGRFEGFSTFAKSYFWLNQGLAKLETKESTFYESLYRSYFE